MVFLSRKHLCVQKVRFLYLNEALTQSGKVNCSLSEFVPDLNLQLLQFHEAFSEPVILALL